MSPSRKPLAHALAIALAAVAALAVSEPAQAGNRKASCGGQGQTPCRLGFPDFMIPSCDTTIPWLYENFAQDKCLALGCGGLNQRACTLAEHVPSCNGGFVELIGPSGAFCRQLDADGFPTVCGGINERPCLVTEHIPSCKPTLGEVPFPGGLCIQLDGDGFPPFCGDENERGCFANEHLPSCKPGLLEIPFPGGTCMRPDADGFPPVCGDAGERACLFNEHAVACKPSAYEVPTPNLPLGANGRCVGHESFASAPFSLSRPAAQAPAGPRSIFLVHGLGGDRNSLKLDDLHDPGRGFVRHWFDYNASGAYAAYQARVLKGNGSLACARGEQIDGYAFSLPDASRLLRDMLLDPACRDQSAGATPRDAQGFENVTLIAHSMGGLVVRDLVARHYDELLAAGIRIAEVITAGSPHRGGGAALPETWDAIGAMCLIPPNAAGSFGLLVHQSCGIERWFSELRAERVRRGASGAPFIDNRDFPGIRWVAIAAADADVVAGVLSFGTLAWGLAPAARHDALVAHTSAFGLSVDFCFPNLDAAPPASSIPARDPHSSAWFEHFWPADLFVSPLRFAPPWGAYDAAHGFDLSASAAVSASPLVLGRGSLFAACHSPGPHSPAPERSYLFDAQAGRFPLAGVSNPHGDIVDIDEPQQYRGGVAVSHYIKTLLSDGLRTGDANGDGNVDGADRTHVLAAIAAGPTSAEEPAFDVWSDLDGDGFLTLADLQAGGLTDADADGMLDASDNCALAANPNQSDVGGVGAGSAPDGIGDACQCGDANDDGFVTGLDGTSVKRAALGLAPFAGGVASLAAPNKCDVSGGATGDPTYHCSGLDGSLIQRASLGLAPGAQQVCPAADGS